MTHPKARNILLKLSHFFHLDALSPFTRRIIIGVIGSFFLLLGIALVFLPGPAFVVIPIGLAILATEFEWARRWLHKAGDAFHKLKKRKSNRAQTIR